MYRALLILCAPIMLGAQSARTTIVMLGTGTPIPDPDRMGPSVAVIVDSVPYIFDAGTGIVRRAVAAQPGGRGRPAHARAAARVPHASPLRPHARTRGPALHALDPGRTAPLEVYGPPGTRRLVRDIIDGNDEDIHERLASSGGPSPDGWKANVHEITAGVVYKRRAVTIRAFRRPAQRVEVRVRLSHRDAGPHDRHQRRHAAEPGHRGGVRRLRRADPRGVLRLRFGERSGRTAAIPRAGAYVGDAAWHDRNGCQAEVADPHAPALLRCVGGTSARRGAVDVQRQGGAPARSAAVDDARMREARPSPIDSSVGEARLPSRCRRNAARGTVLGAEIEPLEPDPV